MSEVTTSIDGEQKAAVDASTAARNKVHTSRKKYGMKAAIIVALIPILYVSAAWLNGWLNTPSPSKVPATTQAVVPVVQDTPPPVSAMTETKLDLDETEWTEVIAYTGQCTWFLTPPGAKVEAEARTSEKGATWVAWDDWKSSQFGALRFRGTEVVLKQKATEPDGSCKYE